MTNATESVKTINPPVAETESGRSFLQRRLATRQQAFLLFSAVAVPVYSWAIFRFLERMTGWLYFHTIGEILSILAYVLLFALFESAVITILLLLLAAILPRSFFHRHLVSTGAMLFFIVIPGLIIFHYRFDDLRQMSRPLLLAGVAAYGLIALGLYLLVQRSQPLRRQLHNLAERLSVLTYIYVPLSLLALIVVLVRNLL